MKPFKAVKPFQIRWGEPLGEKECPYMVRWVFNCWIFSIRIHKWIRSDDKRFFHDHPWSFVTFVLRGSYTDVSPRSHIDDHAGEIRDTLSKGSVRYRSAKFRHYVEVPVDGALTLVLAGPPVRNWGYWVKGKFKRPLRYFHKYGHPPCSEQ